MAYKAPPCYKAGEDCSERYPGCHGKCEVYIEWENGKKIYDNKVNANKRREQDIDGFKAEQCRKSCEFAGEWKGRK